MRAGARVGVVRPPCTSVISGGMTNRNYRVTTATGDYVVRVSVRETGELGIDRDNEHRNSILAADAGVGAPVIARVAEPEALVVGFVDGVTRTPKEFEDPRPGSPAGGGAQGTPRGAAVRSRFRHGPGPEPLSPDRR